MKSGFFSRHSFKILLVVAFLLPFMFAGTRRSLRSNSNDVKSWLPASYEETATFQWYRKFFSGDAFILVSWEGCTLDSPNLPMMARLLAPHEGEADPDEFPFFSSARTGKTLLNMLVEEQGLEPEEAVERLRGFLIGQDGQTTCLVLTVAKGAQERWEAEQAQGIRGRQKFLHAAVARVVEVATDRCGLAEKELRMGGPPVDNVAIDVEGERSLYRLAGVCGIVGLFMAWWCLRNWALTAMVVSTALFSAGCSLAVVWLTGSTMNAILLTMPSLVYVAATSGAIHLANYYRDTVREKGIEGAPDRAVKAAWLPLFLATGTTAVGLASLSYSELVPIKMFGIYSAVGVVISFVLLCTYMPALLQFFPLRTIADSKRPGPDDPFLSPKWAGVGELIIRRHKLVLAGCFTLTIVGFYGFSKVETSVKLMRLFSPQARIIQDYAWLEENLGPLVPMEVVIRVDRKNCQLDTLDQLHMVEAVRSRVDRMEEVGSCLAATSFTPNLPARPGLIERRAWNVRLNRDRTVEDLHEYRQADGNEELWRISARVDALTDLDYAVFIKDIETEVERVLDVYREHGIEGVQATYTGLVPLIYKAQHSLLDGLILGFIGDLILICVAMVFFMRSFTAGLLLALPCLFPLSVVFGAMGLMGVIIDVGTVMTPAVAFGVTVDDAIHFMLWCRHGQERGMSRHKSIMFAYGDCARAIYQSWGVIGLGLAAFALSTFTPTRRFGYLMLTMLTASSIGNLVFLPALLASPLAGFFWKGGEEAIRRKREAEEEAAAERAEPAPVQHYHEPAAAAAPHFGGFSADGPRQPVHGD